MTRFALFAAGCLLLAACGDDPAPVDGGDENLDARGEVLGGSISDDMLPLDTTTSQSPSRVDEAPPAVVSEPAAAGATEETPAEAAVPEDPGEDDVDPVE